ncbi:hypothetical protein PVAP13_3KG379527 [Panicum virgatum]|uniref:Uncharacterized protein n=1 Tax=Panicum virgatum TaxID=38727 RepID=A0A8T0UKM5_PANVG|nr:hypothetical protein PVAP13_3KG379527 [Panicum virgatum]
MRARDHDLRRRACQRGLSSRVDGTAAAVRAHPPRAHRVPSHPPFPGLVYKVICSHHAQAHQQARKLSGQGGRHVASQSCGHCRARMFDGSGSRPIHHLQPQGVKSDGLRCPPSRTTARCLWKCFSSQPLLAC